MSPATALAFAAAIFVLAATPGPGILATVSRSLASGARRSLPLILGLILGDLIYLLLAVYGLSYAARALGGLFVVVKLLGGAYLVFLGVRLWLTRASGSATSDLDPPGSALAGLLQGLITTLANPKVILFYGGFLPTFVDLQALALPDVLLLAGIVVPILFAVFTGYALLAERARRLIRSPDGRCRLNRVSGTILIVAGVWIAARS